MTFHRVGRYSAIIMALTVLCGLTISTVATSRAGAVNGFTSGGESPVAIVATDGGGFDVVGNEGEVATYGDAVYYGGVNYADPPSPISAIATTAPDQLTTSNPKGYWLAGTDGDVFNQGGAVSYGSLVSLKVTPAKPIVGIAGTPDAKGYWLVGADGGIFAFGDAAYHGSMGGQTLAKPIVGMAATPDGHGYWLVGADGGIFAFGDATFYGSMGGQTLTKPIVGMAATPDGKGYWLVGADGGIFAFGDATFYGSMGGQTLAKPIVGMAATPDGKGYWMVGADGGIFAFGDASFDPYRGRVLSNTEQTTAGISISRDCGWSRQLPSGPDLWLFCDTAELHGTWDLIPGAVTLGDTYATDTTPNPGSSPTSLVDGTNGSGSLVNFLPPLSIPPARAELPKPGRPAWRMFRTRRTWSSRTRSRASTPVASSCRVVGASSCTTPARRPSPPVRAPRCGT